jgi:nicotinamidase-related amidase
VIRRTLTDFCHPEQTALVIYDMQVGILKQMPNGDDVVRRVIRLRDVARQHGLPVFYLRHLSMPKPLMGSFQMRQAMAWQRTDDPADVRPWFLRGSPAFEIVPELMPHDDEGVFDKIGFSAFEGTPLSTVLRDLGRPSFLLCGVATEIGLDPTCRQACDLEFVPILVEDAVAPGDAEAGERTLASLRHLGDVIVATTDDVAGRLAA